MDYEFPSNYPVDVAYTDLDKRVTLSGVCVFTVPAYATAVRITAGEHQTCIRFSVPPDAVATVQRMLNTAWGDATDALS